MFSKKNLSNLSKKKKKKKIYPKKKKKTMTQYKRKTLLHARNACDETSIVIPNMV